MILTDLSITSLFPYALLPLGVLLVFAVAMIPCLLVPGTKIGSSMKALYCYAMQCVGVALMSAGALPAVYGVLGKFADGIERFGAEMYLALLLLFSCGGITFLWHEQIAERIDDMSRRVPALLFWYTFKFIGYLLALTALLSFLFTMLLTRPLAGTWWITPIVVLLYGLLLLWCTRWPPKPSAFKSVPMNGGMKHAVAVKGKKR